MFAFRPGFGGPPQQVSLGLGVRVRVRARVKGLGLGLGVRVGFKFSIAGKGRAVVRRGDTLGRLQASFKSVE